MKANRKSYKSTTDRDQNRKNISNLKTRHTEERVLYLASLIDNISDALISTDMEFNILEWNAAAERMYGWRAAEVTDRLLQEFIQSEFIDTTREDVIKAVMEKGSWKGEVKQNRRDGTRIPVMASVSLVKDGSGKSVGFVAINRDISGRKQTEAALREKEAQIRTLSDNLPDGYVYQVDFGLHGEMRQFNYVSAGVERLHGVSAQQALDNPMALYKQMLEEDRSRVAEIEASALASMTTFKAEARYRMGSGQIGWMLMTSTPRKLENNHIVWDGIALDITERKRAEQALEQSERTFSVIFNKAPFAAGLTRLSDGAYLEVNEEFERVFGLSREEIIGKTSLDLGMYPDPEVRASLAALFLKQGFVHNLDLRLQTRTGEIHDVLINSDLVEIGGEKYVLTTANDITERRIAEQKLQLQNQRLKILREIDMAILAADSVEDIVGAALDHIRELIECRRANLTLIDWGTNELVIFQVRTADETSIPSGSRLPIGLFEDIIPTLSRNQPILFNDLLALADPMPGIQRLLKDGLRSTCSLPLFSHGNLIGMFSMHSEIPGFFDEEKIDLGREVANQVAIAITQNRLIEALREQQTRQKDILDGMLTFVGLISLDGILLDVNRAALAAVGLEAKDLIGKPFAGLQYWSHSEATQARVHEAVQQAASGEIVREDFLARIVGDQVITVDILFNPLRDASGNIVQVVASGVDITERKRAEEALRENETRLQSIIDTEPECVKILDLNGRLLEMNPAGLAMIEADSLDDVIGQEVANLVVPEQRMAFRDLTQAISKGETGTLIFEIDGLKGTRRWLETHAVPLRDKMGSVTAILGITLDITDRKQAEQQIQKQLKYLNALRMIDMAIVSSFDLKITSEVMLREVISQLQVDAAALLLTNETTRILEYAGARGFRSNAIQKTSLRLGEGFAGRAIMARQTIHISNLMETDNALTRSLKLENEFFSEYFGVPLIAKGQVKGVLEIYHRSAFNPDKDWLNFLDALAGQAAIAIDNAKLFQDLQRSNMELSLSYEETIEGWSRALDLRDKETEGHTLRVTELALSLARAMNIREAELVHIRHGALLHDIGKMGIPDSILLKPSSLTSEEWEIMRKHPLYAYELLSPIRHLKDTALNIPYCHHEKWDGTGYPRGLKGEQIPLAARIFSVVDVWDAITSNRPYRPAWTKENARTYIREQSGIYFDPRVVDAFLNLIS